VANNAEIGEGATLAAKAGAANNKKIPPKTIYAGFPARPMNEWKEQIVFTRRGSKSVKNLDEKMALLEAKLSELESRLKESETSKI